MTRGQYDELSVCWNNLFRRIFNIHRPKWESVKVIQYYCGSLDFTWLCDLYRLCFLHKRSVCQNAALKECFYRTDVDYLFNEYNVNFTFSLSAVSDAVHGKFFMIFLVF